MNNKTEKILWFGGYMILSAIAMALFALKIDYEIVAVGLVIIALFCFIEARFIEFKQELRK